MFQSARYKKFARVAVIIVSIGVVFTYVPLLFVPKAQAPTPEPASPDVTPTASVATGTEPVPAATSSPTSTPPATP